MRVGVPVSVTRRHAVGGVLWTATQRWAVRLTTLVVFVILGRLLDPHEFGLVALAGVFVGLVNIFSDFGLPTYLVQAAEIDQRAKSTVFWLSLGLSCALTLMLAAASPLVAAAFHTPALSPVVAVMSLTIAITAFSATPSALLRRELDFRAIAVRSIIATVASAIVAVTLALAGAGVWALVAQALVFNSVSAVVLWLASGWRPSWVFDRATARKAGTYGVSVLGIQVVNEVRQHGDALVIGAIAGTTALGFWTVATRVLSVVTDSLVQVISTVSTPVFARLKDEPARLRRGYVSSVSIGLTLITPVLMVLLVASPYAVEAAFGEKWAQSAPVVQVLCVATLFTSMAYFDRGLMLALGRQRIELVIVVVTTVLGVPLMAVVAPWGLVPLAFASVARAGLAWPVRVRVTTRALDLRVSTFVASQGRTLLAGIMGAVPAYLLTHFLGGHIDRWPLIGLVVVATAVIYVPAIWVLDRNVVTEILSAARRTTFAAGPEQRPVGSRPAALPE